MSRLFAGLLVAVLAATSFADTDTAAIGPDPEVSTTPEATVEPVQADAKFPLKVVKVMPDAEQALLFDKTKGRYVLVEVGATVGDYTVRAIDAREVTLVGKDLPVEIALAMPIAKKPVKAVAKTAPKPADPYGEDAVASAEPAAPPAGEAPEDPYADGAPAMVEGDDEPRIVSADPAADPERAAEIVAEQTIQATQWNPAKSDGAKSSTSPFAGMSADAAKPSDEVANLGKPKADAEGEAPAAKVAPTAEIEPPAEAPAAPVAEPEAKPAATQLAKKDVDAALTDFAKLAAAIDGSFGAHGLVIAKVQAGSVFAKAGLAAGDVVTAVDGKPLRSIDDAADLYARAGGMKSATVQIVRNGKPQVLRIAIQ